MNKRLILRTILGVLSAFADSQCSSSFGGTTTIDASNHNAYAANIGWMTFLGDPAHGAVIGEYVCSGYIYSANVGWINLGNGLPPDRIYYRNNAVNDFGVIQDGLGNLRGLAYGANIGWISFESSGAPKVDLRTGDLSGYAWSANCGWISLSNTVARVRTDSITPGLDSDGNGLPDAWELLNFGSTHVDPAADPDNDGISNLDEYLAGTNPKDAASGLRITSIAATVPGTVVSLVWSSGSNRFYNVFETLDLSTPPAWFDSGLGTISPDGGDSTTRTIHNTNAPVRFYRVKAFRPLLP